MVKHLLKVMAQEKAVASAKKDDEKKEKFPGIKPSVTHHVINVKGKPLKYKATAGYLELKDRKLKLKCRMFYISYEKEGVKEKAKRAITFAFNGGPGAASAWVHFGCMGPKRIKLTDEGEILPPPYEFDDNEETWLDFTDLVFIDPIGTGFSIPDKEEDPKQFFDVEQDINITGDFIRLWTTKNSRWLSPKFIAGESYGTFRAVGIANYLQTMHALDVNGIMLISAALNFQYLHFDQGNDLPYALYLPAYAVTARYHNKLAPELQEMSIEDLAKMVVEWSVHTYTPALMKGTGLRGKEREEILDKLAYFTSLSKDYIDECDLRVSCTRFRKKLLRKERKVIGVYDGRLTATDMEPAGDYPKTDPSLFNVYGACIAALNDFIKKEMKYDNELPYSPLSREVSKNWNWASGMEGGMGYVSVLDTLHKSLCYNPFFGVMFCNGYYDLATPFLVQHYSASHLGATDEQLKRVIQKDYEGGHMMYVKKSSRIALYEDTKEFCRKFGKLEIDS